MLLLNKSLWQSPRDPCSYLPQIRAPPIFLEKIMYIN